MNALKLNNNSIYLMAGQIKSQKETILNALYTLFQAGYILSHSSHFKGSGPDAFKAYMENGTLQIVSTLMDLYSDIEMFAGMIEGGFKGFEEDGNGIIANERLEEIKKRMLRSGVLLKTVIKTSGMY